MPRRKAPKGQQVPRAFRIGASWEREVFGVALSPQIMVTPPRYMDFESSMREVIVRGSKGESAGFQDYKYDPRKPKPGISRELWRAVLKNLPHAAETKYGMPQERLFLYLAIGRTALDVLHGADAFFLWRTATVTIDASTVLKTHEAKGDLHLKADFLLTQSNVGSPDGVVCLGVQIAALLMKRVLEPPSEHSFRSGLPLGSWRRS